MSGRPSIILKGASVRVYINERPYNPCQSVQFTVDYGETPIYGIDTPLAQEIATGRITVSGSIQGLRLQNNSSLKENSAITAIKDFLLTPYASIRIQDRQTGEDIIYIPQAKIRNQTTNIVAKGIVKVNFNFIGIMPLEASDRK